MPPVRNKWGRYASVIVLRPSTRGSKARGITMTRPAVSRTGRAKGQFTDSGLSPASMPNATRG
jgi:hypothetical protein